MSFGGCFFGWLGVILGVCLHYWEVCMFLARKESLAKEWFSYLDDGYSGDPLEVLAVTASEPDDFLLAGDGVFSIFRKSYTALRSDVEAPLGRVAACFVSVLAGFAFIKLSRDQKFLRELATVEIARRKRSA